MRFCNLFSWSIIVVFVTDRKKKTKFRNGKQNRVKKLLKQTNNVIYQIEEKKNASVQHQICHLTDF